MQSSESSASDAPPADARKRKRARATSAKPAVQRDPVLYESLKEAAKFWAKRVFCDGSLEYKKGVSKGYKLRKHHATLQSICALVLRGKKDKAGNSHPFKSIDELENYNRQQHTDPNHHHKPEEHEESFAELKARMDTPKRKVGNRTIWHHLRILFKLCKVRQLVKRKRNAKEVQVCAGALCVCVHIGAQSHCAPLKLAMRVAIWTCAHSMLLRPEAAHLLTALQRFATMVLGLEADEPIPVDWQGVFDEVTLMAGMQRIWAAQDIFYWKHGNGYRQWWIDALTVDPKVLLEDQDVISKRGLERMVVECDLANAALGSVPAIQVYIAVHPEHGTKVFFPKNGMKRGKKGALDGADCWTDNITEDQKNFIKSKSMAYYNKPETLKNLEAKRPADRQLEFWEGLFSAKNFLVCMHASQLTWRPA